MLNHLCHRGLFPYNDIMLGVLIAFFILIFSFIISCFFKKKKWAFCIIVFLIFSIIIWQNIPETVRYNIDFNLKQPVKIVELTDFHYNSTCPLIIDYAIYKCNKENPNIVVLVGDYKQDEGIYKDKDLPDKFFNKLKKIKAKKIYAVYGNHDRFEHDELMIKKFEEANIILCDEKIIKENEFLITGVNMVSPEIDKKIRVQFVYNDFNAMKETLKKLPKKSKTIFLFHTPQMFLRYNIEEDILKDKNILFITGHTHGGQFVPPFVDKTKLANKFFNIDYLSGLTEKYNQKVIISKGLGNGCFPFRFGAKPEVTVINLK